MMQRRNGSTLIELIMTVSAGTMMMLLAVTIIHQSMTWSQRMTTRNRDQQSMQRMAEAWREDCSGGISMDTRSESFSSIRLSESRRIEYESRPGMILRREILESTNDTKTVSVEQYAFNDRSRFQFEQLDAPKQVRLMWLHLPETGGESEIVCVVDGVLQGERLMGGDQ